MRQIRLYAVLTGDVVGYSRASTAGRRHLVRALKSTLRDLPTTLPRGACAGFQLYRGDSFQVVLSKPESALRASLIIRAEIRSRVRTARRRQSPDCRVAIGIGTVDSLPTRTVSEGDGEAFRRSGPLLDAMKGEQRMGVRSPWPEVDREIEVEMWLLDAVAGRWSPGQAQAIICQLQGMTQTATAKMLGISQPAVVGRLKDAGSWAVEAACKRYERLILSHISP